MHSEDTSADLIGFWISAGICPADMLCIYKPLFLIECLNFESLSNCTLGDQFIRNIKLRLGWSFLPGLGEDVGSFFLRDSPHIDEDTL